MFPTWQFISSRPDGSISSPDIRKLIRETAMKSCRRRQRLQGVAEFQQRQAQADPKASVAGATSHFADIAGKDREEPQGEQAYALHEQTLILQSGPGDALDPFHKTAMYNHHDAPRLFMHFIHEIAPILQPFGADVPGNPMVSLWPRYAVQDSTMLESLLFHACVHIDMRNGRPWTASTWYHRGRSIELLNQQLALPGDDSTSDLVIGAVGFMGAAGNITGDVSQDIVHRKALHRMVETRGGLEGLGYNGVLAMILPIGDLISSAISDSIPILECPNVDAAATILGLEIPETFARPAKSSLGLPSFRVEIFTLILFLDRVAVLHADSINTLIASTEKMIAFSQICSAIEHRLLSVRIRDTHPDAFVYEAVRIAGLMCMTNLFRKMRRAAAIFLNLDKRLRATIDDLDSLSTVIIDPDSTRLLLWAVCVGSLTALDQVWFARRIKWGISILKIRNLDELSNCLGCFVWTSRMALDFVMVWEQV